MGVIKKRNTLWRHQHKQKFDSHTKDLELIYQRNKTVARSAEKYSPFQTYINCLQFKGREKNENQIKCHRL